MSDDQKRRTDSWHFESKMEKLDEQVTQLRIEVGKLINQRPLDGAAVARGR